MGLVTKLGGQRVQWRHAEERCRSCHMKTCCICCYWWLHHEKPQPKSNAWSYIRFMNKRQLMRISRSFGKYRSIGQVIAYGQKSAILRPSGPLNTVEFSRNSIDECERTRKAPSSTASIVQEHSSSHYLKRTISEVMACLYRKQLIFLWMHGGTFDFQSIDRVLVTSSTALLRNDVTQVHSQIRKQL